MKSFPPERERERERESERERERERVRERERERERERSHPVTPTCMSRVCFAAWSRASLPAKPGKT